MKTAFIKKKTKLTIFYIPKSLSDVILLHKVTNIPALNSGYKEFHILVIL